MDAIEIGNDCWGWIGGIVDVLAHDAPLLHRENLRICNTTLKNWSIKITSAVKTNRIGQSTSSEANSGSDTKEIPYNLGNPEVNYRFHKSPPLVAIMMQLNSVRTIPACFINIHFNIVLPCTSRHFNNNNNNNNNLFLLSSSYIIEPCPRNTRFLWTTGSIISTYKSSANKQTTHTLLELLMSDQILC
jgi:hypothetical protein